MVNIGVSLVSPLEFNMSIRVISLNVLLSCSRSLYSIFLRWLLCSGDEDEGGGAFIVDRLKECPNKLFSAQLW